MHSDPVQITRNPANTRIVPYETGETITLSKEEQILFDAVANVLEYPLPGWLERFEQAIALSAFDAEFSSPDLSAFGDRVSNLTLTEIQEVYTRTFDLNPVCALEIGYHLFGEDYKRGEFLARLRETENGLELGQSAQLPDFLPVLLRLLGRMDDSELRAALIGYCLLPALGKMKVHFEKGENPYGNVFSFLTEKLEKIATRSVVGETEEERCHYV